ncbi:MAG: glycosyltransferase family 2 protein [Anaerolineae bacterium]
MSDRLQASVIIPVWNGEPYLGDCLRSLLAQVGVGFEVIAVDNGSADGSRAVLAGFPAVRMLALPRNRGFAAACNAGAALASGDAVVFLNQDTRVDRDWLGALVAPLEDPTVGVVGCKLLYADGVHVQHAGGYLQQPHWYGRHYGAGESDDGRWDEQRQVPFVTGAAMALRRATFSEHGGFDEGFFPAYFEDVDLCLRLARAGLSVLYEPRARALHHESTSASLIDMPLAYSTSRLRLVLKHCETGEAFAAFMTGEQQQLALIAASSGSRAMAHAYLSAVMAAPSLLAARAVPADVATDVVRSFRELHEQAVAYDYEALLRGHVDPAAAAPQLKTLREMGEQRLGPLREYSFRSGAPLVGPLVARLRQAWFDVAARWALRHLAAQQDERNRRYDEAVARLLDLRQTDLQLAERLAAIEAQLAASRRGGGHRD